MSYTVAHIQNMVLMEVSSRCIYVFLLENPWALIIALWVKIGITESERKQDLFQILSNTKQNIATGTKDFLWEKISAGFEQVPSKLWLNFPTSALNLLPSCDLAVSCHQSSSAFTLQLNNLRLISCLSSATRSVWLTLCIRYSNLLEKSKSKSIKQSKNFNINVRFLYDFTC